MNNTRLTTILVVMDHAQVVYFYTCGYNRIECYHTGSYIKTTSYSNVSRPLIKKI